MIKKYFLNRFSSLRWVIAMLWTTSPRYHLASMCILLLQAIVPLAMLYLVKLLFDAIGLSLHQSFTPDNYRPLIPLFISLLALVVGNELLTNAGALVRLKHNQLITETILQKIQDKSIEVDLQYYENPEYYDTFYRVQTDTPSRILNTLEQVYGIMQSIFSLAAMFGVLLFLHWTAAAIILVSVIPELLVKIIFSQQQYRWQKDTTPAQRENFYCGWLMTGYQAAKELRMLGTGQLFAARGREIRKKLFSEGLAISKRSMAWGFVAKLVQQFAIYGLFLALVLRAFGGLTSIGDLVMYYQLFNRSQAHLGKLLHSASALFTDNLFFADLMRFLQYKSIIEDPVEHIVIPQKIRRIDVVNLEFTYPGNDNQTLKKVNLRLRPGRPIAIVGKNGSGKTSLIKLLCRLYAPTDGLIAVNGIDYTRFRLAEWRERMTVLFQDYMSYQMSARRNIWLGDTKLKEDDVAIIGAAIRSGADDFLRQIPLGYETILGKMFEGGSELSTGQWQKMALSRALTRNASIVILDEPTSALDPQSERKVIAQCKRMARDKILVLVSHRLSVARAASCIYFLQDGKIAEYGTHEELVRSGGPYSRMFRLQQQGAIFQSE